MIKKTLYFGNPTRLSVQTSQLLVEKEDGGSVTIPIEDIGFVVLDTPRVVLTHAVISALLENNVVVLSCGYNHMPAGLLLPFEAHTTQAERYRDQIEASLPLKKNLWQQTVRAKIANQAAILEAAGQDAVGLRRLIPRVGSGDPENCEARAAHIYWSKIFGDGFTRDIAGSAPNSVLNYGYAILRAITARALVGSGLLPALGIFHRNRYNAFPLADDVMEPYRPWVDRIALDIWQADPDMPDELEKQHKARLLQLPTLDAFFPSAHSPLMVAVQRTTASLARCFAGELRQIDYPTPYAV